MMVMTQLLIQMVYQVNTFYSNYDFSATLLTYIGDYVDTVFNSNNEDKHTFRE